MTSTLVRPQLGEPYARPTAVLAFITHGLPQPQGSVKYVGQRRNGSAVLTSDNAKLKPWRNDLIRVMKLGVRETEIPGGWPIIGPVGIDLCFTMRKPVAAPKRRRTWPITKPDIDKLERAVLDSGTYAGLWSDDAQVVRAFTWKVYPGEEPRALSMPGLHCVVYQIDPPTSAEQGSLL